MNSAVLLQTSGLRGERVEHLRDVPGAVVGRPVRVLGEGLGRDDPGDLRQRAGLRRRPCRMSKKPSPALATLVPVRALSYSGLPGCAFWYWLK